MCLAAPGTVPAVRARSVSGRAVASRPNILVILTDDMRQDGLRVMPNVQRLLAGHGVTFPNAIISNTLCCPSRATILTGNYSHTTGIYRNHGATGGATLFRYSDDDLSTFATWLHRAGYRTGLFGKYLNGYHAPYVPPGWSRFMAFNWGLRYYGGQLSVNGRVRTLPGTTYTTSYLARRVRHFILATPPGQPFMAYYAPAAPHEPAQPARRYADVTFPWLYDHLHSNPAYNETPSAGMPSYVKSAPDVNDDRIFRLAQAQLRTLLSVDAQIGRIVDTLKATGRLHNTLILFLSDNGVQWGEQRMLGASKSVPYEGSIRVPLIVRYDRVIRRPRSDGRVVANIDVAPTLAAAAGVSHPAVDGRSFLTLLKSRLAGWPRAGVLLEHQRDKSWRVGAAPAFCGMRTRRWTFAHYAGGYEELYDLRRDPHELVNVIDQDTVWAARLRRSTRSLCRPRPPGLTWPSPATGAARRRSVSTADGGTATTAGGSPRSRSAGATR